MSKLKLVVNVVAILALLWLIFISRHSIGEAFTEIPELIWWLLILQIPIQFASYAAVGHFYYSYFCNTKTVGKLTLKEMYKISLELNFINSIFPSGGVSGFSYLSLRLRPFKINVATTTLAQSLRFALTFLSFLVILGVGLLLLAIDGQPEYLQTDEQPINYLIPLLSGAIFTLTVVGTGIFVFLISSERRIKEFVAWLPKAMNQMAKWLHFRAGKELINITRAERVLGEIHAGYLQLRNNLKALKKPFLYALAINFFELLTIYVVFLAHETVVNPGAVILAYAVANFAGLIAIIPGGIGLYEGLMAILFIQLGVDEGVAWSATLVYRVLNILIFIPPGAFLYHLAVNRQTTSVTQTVTDTKKGILSALKFKSKRAGRPAKKSETPDKKN